MGNWRTVHIVGTVPEEEVPALYDACDYGAGTGYHADKDYDKFHVLVMSDGMMALGFWVSPTIDCSGNLAERDYDPDDVVNKLRELVQVAPGMDLKVHCGGEWEKPEVVCTITVKDGVVTEGPPEVERVRGASQDESMGRFAMGFMRTEHPSRSTKGLPR